MYVVSYPHWPLYYSCNAICLEFYYYEDYIHFRSLLTLSQKREFYFVIVIVVDLVILLI